MIHSVKGLTQVYENATQVILTVNSPLDFICHKSKERNPNCWSKLVEDFSKYLINLLYINLSRILLRANAQKNRAKGGHSWKPNLVSFWV